MFFEEFGPELLWWNGNIRPTLWRKVHKIPIWPHRVDMVSLQFSSPEMEHFSVPLRKDMHNRQLHIIRISLAFVIGLIVRGRSGNQRNLRPASFFGPRIDPFSRSFGDGDKRGVASDLIRGSVKSIDERSAGRARMVPV